MRSRSLLILAIVLHATMLFIQPRSSFGQFEDLLKRIPGQPNSIVAIDVEGLYKSPMAVEKQWKEKFASNWAEQPIIVPPEANRIVLASHLDPLNNLRSAWELAVMELGEPLSMNSIAKSEGGYVDSIDGTPVVWTPSHAYFVGLEKKLLGLVYPDDRQAVSRWIAFATKNQTASLSPYLQAAARRAGVDGQIVMAIDLANVAQPHRLEKSLKELKALEGQKVDLRAVTQAVASVRGVTLVVQIQTQAVAEFRVDFGKNISILKPFAKELVLEALDRFGATVSDPKAWETTVEDTAIIFHGPLSENGLRRISGLLELPTSKFSTLKKESETGDNSSKSMADASLRYFKLTEKLIVDLRQGIKVKGASTVWLEKSSRKIDALPILHVDEELLGFGSWCSKTMRDMAEGVRGITRESNVAQSQVYGNYYAVGSYGDNGYYRNPGSVSNTLGEQTTAAAGSVRTQGMKDINNGLADMRRKMTKKYNVEF
jgi:hypothetical protein